MKDCIFCNIADGKNPALKVYEDDEFLAFLNVFPRTKGHTLVIPKKHYRWIYDIPNFDKFWLVVLKITRRIQNVLKPEWLNYFTYGAVAHAHVHILPRYNKISSSEETNIIPPVITISKDEMVDVVSRIYK